MSTSCFLHVFLVDLYLEIRFFCMTFEWNLSCDHVNVRACFDPVSSKLVTG